MHCLAYQLVYKRIKIKNLVISQCGPGIILFEFCDISKQCVQLVLIQFYYLLKFSFSYKPHDKLYSAKERFKKSCFVQKIFQKKSTLKKNSKYFVL